jgi:uncharacterized membrane protein (UPF0127 family)
VSGKVRARGLALSLCLGLLGLACDMDALAKPGSEAPAASLSIRNQQVELELAITPEIQTRGLGYRDSLAWHHGMLFIYPRPAFHRFWMRGMRFDIDIVWIRGDRIVDISHGVRHVRGENGPTIQPRELADRVLEVPAGYASAHAWRAGDRVVYAGDAAR